MASNVVCSPFDFDEASFVKEAIGKSLWSTLSKKSSAQALVEVETGNSLTYGQLKEDAEQLARHLINHGCKKNDVIALFAPNSVEWIVVMAAVMRIGAVPATVNSLLTAGEITHQLRNSNSKYLYTTTSHAATALQAVKLVDPQIRKVFLVSGHVDGCINIDPRSKQVPNASSSLPSFEELNQSLDDTGLIQFSSGTTGPQKAVLLSQRNIQFIFTSGRHPRFEILRDKMVVFTPLSHITACIQALLALVYGSCVYVMKKFELDTFLSTIDSSKMESAVIVPTIATLMAKSSVSERFKLSNLKDVIVGAAPLGADLEALLLQRYPSVTNIRQMYGMTEVCGACSAVPVGELAKAQAKRGTCGVPLPGILMKVIDLKTGQALGPRQEGEICIKSPTVMQGYGNNPQATKETIDQDGWLHSGDIGFYDEDGYFFIRDRLKELIKYNAYQVAPAELEAVLLSHDGIADAAVVGLPDPAAGELPLAWVVKKPSATVTEAQVQQFVSDRVAPYKKLRGGVEFVSEIPKVPTGKIDRKVIRAELAKRKTSKL